MSQEFLAPVWGIGRAVEFGAVEWLVTVFAIVAAYSLVRSAVGFVATGVPEFRGVKPISALLSTGLFLLVLLGLFSVGSAAVDGTSSAMVLGFVVGGVGTTAAGAVPDTGGRLFGRGKSGAPPERVCETLGIDVEEGESAGTVLLSETNQDRLLYLGSSEEGTDVGRSEVVSTIEALAEESSRVSDAGNDPFVENLRTVQKDVQADRFKHVDDIDTKRAATDSWESADPTGVDVQGLRSELENLQTEYGLSHSQEAEAKAYDLLQDLIRYLDGERTELTAVVDSFEDVVETLQAEAMVLESLRRCNNSLTGAEQASSTKVVRDSLDQAVKSLQDLDSPTATNVTNLFGSLLTVLEKEAELERELQQVRSEREEYKGFYESILQSWDIEWARSHLEVEESATDEDVAKEALSEGLFGARVVAAVARDLRDTERRDIPRGTTAATLLEEIGGASTSSADSVETILKDAISELQGYSIVQNQIRDDIDTETVTGRADSIRTRAAEMSVSGLEPAINNHLDDQVLSLETVRDVDFVTPYVTYEHLERTERLLQTIADNRTQESASFDELDAKREEIEQEFKNKNVHTGNKLSRHYLNIAEELQREAKEAQALGKTDTAAAKADAAGTLMDGLLETYRTRTLRRYLEAV